MQNTLLKLTAASAAMVCSPSFAVSVADAAIDNLTVTIGQIDPKGATPSLSFSKLYPDSASALVYDGASQVERDGFQTGTGAFSYAFATATLNGNSASAVLDGNAFAYGGTYADAFAFVGGGPANSVQYADSNLMLSSEMGEVEFTLGANTYIEISGFYGINALAEANPGQGLLSARANASIGFILNGFNGSNQQSSAFERSISADLRDVGNQARYGKFDISLYGDRTQVSTGQFYGTMTAFASETLSPVPESTNAALILAGIGILGSAARRRRAF